MKYKYLLCACLWLFHTGSAFAQVFMRAFDNSASMAMGGASVAYPDADMGIQNEAIPGFGEKTAVFLSSAIPYGISGWNTAQFQALQRIDANSGAGIDMNYSGTDAYREQRYRLLYGRRIGEALYLGGSADWLRVSAGEYGAASAISFGLGLLVRALPDLWLGARIQNPVRQNIGIDAPSSVLRIGASWKPNDRLVLSAETEKILERPVQIKSGFEYRPIPALILRAGVRGGGAARLGFGAGVRLKGGLGLDMGSEWHPSLGMTPSAMIIWRRP
ncbi:MAG: hypothetical protein H6565_09345 [Lewinellaceae bacterium]|nr:hypothetical protein [Lewinellaceae bacterium]MCB9354417.1 hypothetical protein [Lewinellaceae bacterium]